MHIIQNGSSALRGKLNVIFTAAIFIFVGLFLIGRNTGLIDHSTFRIFISWQMLLIVLGIASLIKRQVVGGTILIGIGTFFLVPRILGAGYFWFSTYWPMVFVIIGVALLFKLLSPSGYEHHRAKCTSEGSSKTENGFVHSNNTFGSVKQIVLDPVFRGARISNTFGGTILDLRHTNLEEEKTYIDIECTFGGIEIFVPGNWTVENKLQHMAGGSDDKRYRYPQNLDTTHKLILRGNLTFGGLEIKS